MDQRGDWDALADIESASKPEQEAEAANQSHDELSDDQQAVLDASWQRLESLIMDQMPAEIAGTYLSVLEQQLHLSKESIARDITLLDDADLESLLDYYQIDRGF